MKHVLILTKTNWNEPPRIRHQVTRLLKKKGYIVTFVEKNTYKSLFIKSRKEEGIQFYSHAELIHHQLRFCGILQYMNNFIEKLYLRRIAKITKFDFIINFNYDYSFLKEITDKKVITIINDDFEAQGKFWMKKQIKKQVKRTCLMSDEVLTVSYPLQNKLKQYRQEVYLFLPWSKNIYKPPLKHVKERNVVLYFGYIGRLDWNLVEELVASTSYNYRFVGPATRKSDKAILEHLKRRYSNNFEHIPFSNFKDLGFEDVFCSILPYNPDLESVQACTVSNRAFNLLSRGLPLAYADLKYLIEAPSSIIRPNMTLDDYKSTLEFYSKNFNVIQKDIKSFLTNHYEEDRWELLENVINA